LLVMIVHLNFGDIRALAGHIMNNGIGQSAVIGPNGSDGNLHGNKQLSRSQSSSEPPEPAARQSFASADGPRKNSRASACTRARRRPMVTKMPTRSRKPRNPEFQPVR